MSTSSDGISRSARRNRLLGHFAMISFAAIIGGSFSLGALAAPHIEPAALNAARFLLAVISMALLVRLLLERPLVLPAAPWRFFILAGMMGTYFVTMFMALKISPPISTSAVFTLVPVMSTICGYILLHQKPSLVMVISLLIAAAGAIWVIFRGNVQAILAFDIGPGEMIFFVGCVGHATFAPLSKLLNRGEPVMIFTLWTLAATMICIAAYGTRDIAATDWNALPEVVWIAIVYLAIFATAGTFFLLQFASLHLPAAKVMSYGYLTPCFVILLEGLLGHGWAGVSIFAGAMLTVVALLVLMLSPEA